MTENEKRRLSPCCAERRSNWKVCMPRCSARTAEMGMVVLCLDLKKLPDAHDKVPAALSSTTVRMRGFPRLQNLSTSTPEHTHCPTPRARAMLAPTHTVQSEFNSKVSHAGGAWGQVMLQEGAWWSA